MPMRQSTLNFGMRATAVTTKPAEEGRDFKRIESPRSSPTNTDTIVVHTTDTNFQLPTPSDSATDVSSETSEVTESLVVSGNRGKRVTSTRTRKSNFREHIDMSLGVEHEKSRSVSGETLVAENALQKDEGVSEKVVKAKGFTEELTVEGCEHGDLHDHEVSSVITVREEFEDERLREERQQAKKAKMDENVKKWQQRKEAAEQNATRRSGRASILNKANEIIKDIKKTVLGKRSRGVSEKDDGTHDDGQLGKGTDSAKKARLEENETTSTAIVKSQPRKTVKPRGKKWLVSGLYAGQPRQFDARLTENKNKRKSKLLQETEGKENKVLPLPMFAGERLLQFGRDFKLPFDVFSPAPAGQPKPDEWKKVNKNVFVGDAADHWKWNKLTEQSICSCSVEKGCDHDCINKYMYYECDERNCVRGIEECNNRAWEGLRQRTKTRSKYNVGVEVIKTEDRGYGVRANRTFMPNQIIVEYTGEIVTQEECERRMRTIYKENECYYLMLFDQNMIIDATRGSIARFVNHSCEPNCRMEKWTVHGNPRMALFAGERGIMTGEELTYDYNFDPYSQKNVQACRCGAENCRGVLGPKPKPETRKVIPENDTARKGGKTTVPSKRKQVEVSEQDLEQTTKKRKVTPAPSGKKGVLVKKAKTTRTVTSPSVVKVIKTTKIARSDSKLKKLIVGAKSKAGSLKRGQRRVVSVSSATVALLGEKDSSSPVKRTSSLKEKAKSLTRSVRGRR